jgi:hypothetical protein
MYELGKTAIRLSLGIGMNSLPTELKQSTNLNLFKSKLKQFI